jgi:PAS domain S-box-containing protein
MTDQQKITQTVTEERALLKERIRNRETAEGAIDELYQFSPEDTPLLICKYFPDCRITYVNRTYCTYFGKTAEELIGTSFLSLIPEEDHETVLTNMSMLNAECPVRTYELRGTLPDGGIAWQRWIDHALFDDRGEITAYQSIGEDITDRKREEARLEESLSESEERYRTLSEESFAGVYVVQGGRFVFINDNAASFAGYRREELEGSRSDDIVHPEDRDRVRRYARGRLTGNDSSPYEFRIIAKDGQVRWIMETVAPINYNGKPAILGNSMDVTSYKKVESERQAILESLQEVRERERGILQSVPHALFGVEQRRIFFANHAMESVFGWKPEELIGKSTRVIFRTDKEWSDYGGILYSLLEKESVVVFEWDIPFVKKDGSEIFCRMSVARIGEELGETVRIVATFEDITARKHTEAKLKEISEIIERSPVVVFLWKNAEGWPVEFVTGNVQELSGYTAEEFISGAVPYSKTVHPDDLGGVAKEVVDHSEDERIMVFDHVPYRIVTKDGTIKWVIDSTFIRRSDEGVITHYQGVLFDITQQEETRAALQESEQRYRDLVETSKDLIYVTDRKATLTYVNPALERTLGYEKGELIGQSFSQIIAPDFLNRARDFFRRAMKGGHVPLYEGTLIRKDGAEICVEFNVTTLVDSEGNPSGRFGVGRDITDRKKAEKKLLNSEKKYREMVDFLPISLFEIDLHGNIISANPISLETFGYEKGDLEKGLNGFQLITSDDRERILEDFLNLMSGEKRGPSEYTGIRKDGSTFPMLVYSSPISSDGRAIGFRGSVIDLTDRKRMEVARNQLIQSEKLASLGRLSAGVAHEILNPVNIISLVLQTLRRGETLSPHGERDLDVCAEQINRIVTITENLKQFSRMPTGKKVMANINTLIAGILALYAPQMKIEEIETETDYRSDLPEIEIDEKKIEQVVINMITNAIVAMEGKEIKKLRVTTGRDHFLTDDDQIIIMRFLAVSCG